MKQYEEFQSVNHDLKMALECLETDDQICNGLIARRNAAAEAIYDDKFVDVRLKLKVAKIDCADLDHAATLNVMARISA